MNALGPEDAGASDARQAAANGAPARRTVGQVAKDILLFFAAPFITMAYLPMFPFIGLAMLFRKGGRAWQEWHATD